MLFNEKNLCLRKLLCAIGIVAVAQFMSCETDDVEEVRDDSSNPQQEQKEEPSLNYKALFSSNHTMGMDEARELALDAASLFAGEGNGLKSGRVRQIEEVRVLRSDETTLRSGSGEVVAIPDTLAYVCNFADSAGFAIICADDRVGCPILACVDNGTLGEDTDNPGLAIFLDNAQVFMRNSIMKFEMEKDSLLEVARQEIPETTSVTLKRMMTGNYYYLKEEVRVGPLLRTEWAQKGDPYNNLMKSCGSSTEHAPAGCWAVAIGQLMAYYKFPIRLGRTSGMQSGDFPDWSVIAVEKYAENLDFAHRKQVSDLLYEVGCHIGMNWQCDGSGANSDDVVNYMKSLGFIECCEYAYDFDFIKDCFLDIRRPVCMSGYENRKKNFIGYSLLDGHAWVADGYTAVIADHYSYVVDLSRGVCKEFYVNTVLKKKYLHVNWGWGGSNNGYFAEGCFDTMQGIYDEKWMLNDEVHSYKYKISFFPFCH